MADTPKRVLVVLAHGWTRTPDDLCALQSLIQTLLPGADIERPRLDIGFLSGARANDVSLKLASEIEARFRAGHTDGGAYDEVMLVGHSVGGQILRAAWTCGMGAAPDASLAEEPLHSWARKVTRIVLLAAMARGWSPNVAMSPMFRLVVWASGSWEFIPFWRSVIFDFRRGSQFQTMLRLQWLALTGVKDLPIPRVVQILGTIDDLVIPSDHIDLSVGDSFHYLEAAGADHFNIVGPLDGNRRIAIELALTGSQARLAEAEYSLAEIADVFNEAPDDHDAVTAAPRPKREVKQAVMIMHGIRDLGFWTKKLAMRVKKIARAEGNSDCRTVTSTYGFFPMGPFLLPQERLKRVEWFMDQYVQTRALYPNAKISFIGHSNGTYLFAGALECPAVKFDNVVFAGSVVRRNFDWAWRMRPDRHGQPTQIGAVLNYVATKDWVVASFPKFLQRLRIFNLGSAGHDGFSENPEMNVCFATGQHDAAIRDNHWTQLAQFVLSGKTPSYDKDGSLASSRSGWWLYLLSWLAIPVALTVTFGLGAGIFLMTYNFLSQACACDIWKFSMCVAVLVVAFVARLILRKL